MPKFLKKEEDIPSSPGDFVRESYLGVFGIWAWESASTPICIFPNLIW